MHLLKLTKSIGAVLAGYVFLVSSADATEIPNYRVEFSEDRYEIRYYPPMLLAEVQVTGNREAAAGKAFRRLAGFIFGNNRSSSKINMTAPVGQVSTSSKIEMTAPVGQRPMEEKGKWLINFMMPSKYDLSSLPVPNDPGIRVYETTPYRTVSVRFSGWGEQHALDYFEKELREFAAINELSITGEPEYAFYDAPYVPAPFRRNEIHFRLDNKNSAPE